MGNSSAEESKNDTQFESAVSKLIHETRGLLGILKSVKGLEEKPAENQLYRITLKRFRDNCLRLASYLEACSILVGDDERDRILGKNGCSWDTEKKRVSLG